MKPEVSARWQRHWFRFYNCFWWFCLTLVLLLLSKVYPEALNCLSCCTSFYTASKLVSTKVHFFYFFFYLVELYVLLFPLILSLRLAMVVLNYLSN